MNVTVATGRRATSLSPEQAPLGDRLGISADAWAAKQHVPNAVIRQKKAPKNSPRLPLWKQGIPKADSVDGQNIGTPSQEPLRGPLPLDPRSQCCVSNASMSQGPNILSIGPLSHIAHNIEIGGRGRLTLFTRRVPIFCPSTVLVLMLFGPAKLQL